MAAIMGEWQRAILTGGHKAAQQLQRERRGEMSQEETEQRRRGASFKEQQMESSLSNESKLTESGHSSLFSRRYLQIKRHKTWTGRKSELIGFIHI